MARTYHNLLSWRTKSGSTWGIRMIADFTGTQAIFVNHGKVFWEVRLVDIVKVIQWRVDAAGHHVMSWTSGCFKGQSYLPV